jgi:adenine-specific DNA-methyltransferase
MSYMGTKQRIAGDVASVIAPMRDGPMLDLFAGMASVSKTVGTSRQAWLNDAQQFSCVVNRYQFQFAHTGNIPKSALALFRTAYHWNRAELAKRFDRLLANEADALTSLSVESNIKFSQCLECELHAELPREIDQLIKGQSLPYRLFAYTHSGGYIGLMQAIEVDSIRFAIDSIEGFFPREGMVKPYLIAALGSAVKQCAASTGHFAQYLSPKEANIKRWTNQRHRSVSSNFKNAVRCAKPVGDRSWRENNRVFHGDANALLSTLQSHEQRPAVVYADPPYTADHYSRYYHLLETLVDYKYQNVFGKGRYRPDRFTSDFSIKTKIYDAFVRMIKGASQLGSGLVINYPEYGLLENSEQLIPDLLSKHFKSVCTPIRLAHQHSTLGASKGEERRSVSEFIYVATT